MKKIVTVLLTMALCSTASSQLLDKEKLDLLFDRIVEKNKGMGSIAITKEGRIIYTRGFGYSQVSETIKKPITADTKFRIASITKTYTAVMILQLVEEGKLQLADRLAKFFPQIPNAATITIDHILHHRSGIPDIATNASFRTGTKTHVEVLAAIAKAGSAFEPGSKHEYSNAGFVLLGYIVEQLSGQPYQLALQKRITSKIGLTNTYLGIDNTDTTKNESLSYRYMGGWKEAPEMNFSVPAGAGAIVSTPTEMAAFIHALFDGKLIAKKSLEQMKTMIEGEGMGMEVFSFAGKTEYGHTGGSNASGSWLAYDPQEQLAVAYTTNAKIYPVAEIIKGVFAIYWHQPFDIPSLEAFVVAPGVLDQYAGTYIIAGTPAKMIVTRKEGTLYIQNGNSAVPLEATAENRFKIDPGVIFEFDAAKKTLRITRPQGSRTFTKENQ